MQPKMEHVKVPASADSLLLTGFVGTDETVRRFNPTTGFGGKIAPAAFNCTFYARNNEASYANMYYALTYEWAITMCALEPRKDFGLVSDMWPIPPEEGVEFSPGPLYLIINATKSPSEWGTFTRGADTSINRITSKGEWLTLETGVPGFSLDVTLCSIQPAVQDTIIYAERLSPAQEPVALWDASVGLYKTEEIQARLVKSAGNFKLAKKDSWLVPPSWIYLNETYRVSNNPPSSPGMVSLYAFADFPMNGTRVMSLGICGYCCQGVSRLHAAVFQDIFPRTGNVAIALQSLITSVFQMAYNDQMMHFDASKAASITSVVDVARPIGHRFFTGVVALMLSHLLLVSCITVLFVTMAKDSVLGSAWAAAAQP